MSEETELNAEQAKKMGQTDEEVFKTFFPMTSVVAHPGGSGADSICIGSPRPDIHGYDRMSDCFPVDTNHARVWANAYKRFIERVSFLFPSALPEEKEDGFENTFLSLLYEADEPLTRKDVVRVWNAAKEAKR
jgi:hypothetical protein